MNSNVPGLACCRDVLLLVILQYQVNVGSVLFWRLEQVAHNSDFLQVCRVFHEVFCDFVSDIEVISLFFDEARIKYFKEILEWINHQCVAFVNYISNDVMQRYLIAFDASEMFQHFVCVFVFNSFFGVFVEAIDVFVRVKLS